MNPSVWLGIFIVVAEMVISNEPGEIHEGDVLILEDYLPVLCYKEKQHLGIF